MCKKHGRKAKPAIQKEDFPVKRMMGQVKILMEGHATFQFM